MEYANTLGKLGLDFGASLPLRLGMSEDAEARRDLIRRLFCLITIAAEDAAAVAVEGQSRNSSPEQAQTSAAGLQELGMRIEILSSAITEVLNADVIE